MDTHDPAIDSNLLHALLALQIERGNSTTRVCREVKLAIERGEQGREELLAFLEAPSRGSFQHAEHELERASDYGISTTHLLSPDYPELLREISDPPLVLFYRGSLGMRFGIAVVGTRTPSEHGRKVCRSLVRAVIEHEGSVVSGLAYGIDSEAHAASIKYVEELYSPSSPGISVLGSGLCRLYPAAHFRLAEKLIEAGGAVVSEYLLDQEPRSYTFPRRNRIISGLAEASVVVEAKERSGTLITARLACEQGRNVFAVPGRIDDPLSAGPLKLLREGAEAVSSPEDILQYVSENKKLSPQNRKVENASKAPKGNKGAQRQSKDQSKPVSLSQEDSRCSLEILKTLEQQGPLVSDELCERLNLSPAQLASLLSHLELEGLIVRVTANAYDLSEIIDSGPCF